MRQLPDSVRRKWNSATRKTTPISGGLEDLPPNGKCHSWSRSLPSGLGGCRSAASKYSSGLVKKYLPEEYLIGGGQRSWMPATSHSNYKPLEQVVDFCSLVPPCDEELHRVDKSFVYVKTIICFWAVLVCPANLRCGPQILLRKHVRPRIMT
jgi:hypothetical protein